MRSAILAAAALAAVDLALVYAPEILALLRGSPVYGELPRGAVG